MKNKITYYSTRLLIAFLIGNIPFLSQGQGDTISIPDYIIYSSKKEKIVDLDVIVRDSRKHHVVFFGEEHNDSITHVLQFELYKKFYKKFKAKTTLSMEMFDRDVQYILDEYLKGQIKESYFNKDSRKWKNYKDYKPMVEFAKEKKLDIIAANAPFRYVNIASNKGSDALTELTDFAKLAIAPLPYNIASGDYKDKLEALMSHSPIPEKKDSVSNSSPPKKPSVSPRGYNILFGQSLWDSTMAYSIAEYLKENPDNKILHLNGRFHTDERFGIVQRLAEYDANIKSLVISSTGIEASYPNIDFEKFRHLGDYIIFTNPEISKSY